jgi:hypothetical protein
VERSRFILGYTLVIITLILFYLTIYCTSFYHFILIMQFYSKFMLLVLCFHIIPFFRLAFSKRT